MTSSPVFFVADVHVAPEDSPSVERFLAFLRSLPGRARALFILGDLFDLWSGGADARLPGYRRVLDVLESLHRAGVPVTFLAGNRDIYLHDFLVKSRSFDSVRDRQIVSLDGKRILLCHGDLLCAADRAHLRVRRILASAPFRVCFLALPAFVARFLARSLRRASLRSRRRDNPRVVSLDDSLLRSIFASGVDVIICGHTHRPEHRVFDLDGRRCELFVLPAWTDNPAVLELHDGVFTSIPVVPQTEEPDHVHA